MVNDMKIALISDIHGNLPALEAVLADVESQSIDQIICLGDVAIFGPQPRETLARLQGLGCPVAMGNTDAWALNPQSHAMRDEETAFYNAIEGWGAAQLTEADRAFIRTFQPTILLPLPGDQTLLCYHGSPRSFHDVILATTPGDALASILVGRRATVLAGGHTHTPMVRRYQDLLIVNPGSVGLPYETMADGQERNPPWAEYAVLNASPGRLAIELRRVQFNVDSLRRAVIASDMPHAEWWLKDW
jgi:putative phosphoesterase